MSTSTAADAATAADSAVVGATLLQPIAGGVQSLNVNELLQCMEEGKIHSSFTAGLKQQVESKLQSALQSVFSPTQCDIFSPLHEIGCT